MGILVSAVPTGFLAEWQKSFWPLQAHVERVKCGWGRVLAQPAVPGKASQALSCSCGSSPNNAPEAGKQLVTSGKNTFNSTWKVFQLLSPVISGVPIRLKSTSFCCRSICPQTSYHLLTFLTQFQVRRIKFLLCLPSVRSQTLSR